MGKFAHDLNRELLKKGIISRVAGIPDMDADINHHIIYCDFQHKTTIDTLMVTHIDYIAKARIMRDSQDMYDMGICMSDHTVQQMRAIGVAANKLTYISPAHDFTVLPRKIRLFLSFNLYPDGRKNEEFLVQLPKDIDMSLFSIVIMGSGWEQVTEQMRANGLDVKLYKEFDKDIYNSIFKEIDYLLFMGHDEGSMSFLDAVAAGVDTIVTNQGYHLDIPGAITHGFNTYDELKAILKELGDQKKKKIDSIASWSWENYALDHIAIWNKLLMEKGKADKVVPVSSPRYSSQSENHASLGFTGKLKYIITLLRNSLSVRKKL